MRQRAAITLCALMLVSASAFALTPDPKTIANEPAVKNIIAHPSPPDVKPMEQGMNPEQATPILAPAPATVRDQSLGSVTCFPCPSGNDTYRGAICMNGVACAAEGVTLEQLNIREPKTNPALNEALRKLEQARVELKKPAKTQSRSKALQYINTALTELKTVGLKTGCKSR